VGVRCLPGRCHDEPVDTTCSDNAAPHPTVNSPPPSYHVVPGQLDTRAAAQAACEQDREHWWQGWWSGQSLTCSPGAHRQTASAQPSCKQHGVQSAAQQRPCGCRAWSVLSCPSPAPCTGRGDDGMCAGRQARDTTRRVQLQEGGHPVKHLVAGQIRLDSDRTGRSSVPGDGQRVGVGVCMEREGGRHTAWVAVLIRQEAAGTSGGRHQANTYPFIETSGMMCDPRGLFNATATRNIHCHQQDAHCTCRWPCRCTLP
jgi:hypothetical protein